MLLQKALPWSLQPTPTPADAHFGGNLGTHTIFQDCGLGSLAFQKHCVLSLASCGILLLSPCCQLDKGAFLIRMCACVFCSANLWDGRPVLRTTLFFTWCPYPPAPPLLTSHQHLFTWCLDSVESSSPSMSQPSAPASLRRSSSSHSCTGPCGT